MDEVETVKPPVRKFGVSGGTAGAKYTFTLNVAYAELDKLLGCAPVTKNFGIIPPKNSTKIEDILGQGTNASSCTFSFLDPSKKNKRWVVTMKDAIKHVVLPTELTTPVKCWWCHDPFTSNPLGCPIKLIDSGIEETTYYSHSSKKDTTVLRKKQISDVNTEDRKVHYLTKGYFCCWECLLGFGESMVVGVAKPEFRECIQLIYHMFKAFGGEGTITPAPHYTMKQEYGGPLTPQEYKTKYETYSITGNSYVRMVPTGELFEVTSKF